MEEKYITVEQVLEHRNPFATFPQQGFKVTKYVTTDEDWYPTVDGKLKVLLLRLPPWRGKDSGWRVLVRGGDDFGMERNFRNDRLWEAVAVYNAVEDGVLKHNLLHSGFDFI